MDPMTILDGPDSRSSQRRLRIAFVVTEYPKTTETFILRDIMEFHRAGCEILIFSLTHFNTKNLMHDFAKATRSWAHDYAYLASADVLGAVAHYVRRQPRALAGILRDIFRGSWRDPVMLLKSLVILPKSLRIARELQGWGADHVHAAYAGHPATAAWVVWRVAGIPFSASSHAHDLFETQALLATKLPEASFVRTISQFNRAFLLRHVPALADNPPLVIHVGTYLQPQDGQSQPTDRANRPGEAAGGFRVLYVGSLEYRKGVDLLLRALSEAGLDDWRLEVVGDGPERGRLERLTQALGLIDRVSFRGALPNEAVGAAMRRASLLAVPSRIGPRNQTEGLPTVIVEALSVRLPVIATRLTGIPEIVQHEQTGLLFEMEDVAGIAQALRRMHDDPAAAAAWATAGQALVRAEFDQERNARLLLDRIVATLDREQKSA